MGWFNDQIEYRKTKEKELLTDSFQNVAKAVSGHKIGDGSFEEDLGVRDALSQLLKYYNIKDKDIPPKVKDLEDRIDYLFSSSGVLYREVKLQKGWHKDAMGAMLTSMKEDGAVITLLPGGSGGYVYQDPHTGRKVKVTRVEEEKINQDAFCFYRSFPMRKLKLIDLYLFMRSGLTNWDKLSYYLAAAVITLVGLIIPKLNTLLVEQVPDYGSYRLLAAVMFFMFSVTVGNLMFGSIRSLLLTRMNVKMSIDVGAATMMRVLSLPADFFKNYSTGELTQYLGYMNGICNTIINTAISTLMTGLFSLVYLFSIFSYAKSLVLPAMIVTLATLAVSMLTATLQMTISKEMMKVQAKEKGMLFSLISGVQKIRLAGAEKRVFARWTNVYAKEASYIYNPPALLKLNTVITTAIGLIGTIVIYYRAVTNGVSQTNYVGFTTSYGYISTAFTALASVATTIANIRPSLELIEPLMNAEPECEENLETVTGLSGSIELSHVSFRYTNDGPMILDDISLNIPARQYVAIVGKTGCGKSTLLRLLLGFEKPVQGSIFYDRKDTRRLDMHSVRKKIGTVTQDGKLFQGSIFENITISAPALSVEDAWRAAEIAGIADDIRSMPMGMHTVVAEGAGGISGGQKQRIMIARAVAPRPKILFLDEATSALDNITQKNVSDALDQMRCTRIVIAHRLSTIRHCDRILVLDHGKIIEDGTYEELIAKQGFFADLVERQRV